MLLTTFLVWLLGTLQAPLPVKQAVVETSAGTFIIDLAPEQAPAMTAHFIKTAGEGGYTGTIFHKMIKYGIIQGGDPLTKDPAKRGQYGTGGLSAVKDEPRAATMTRGSVAAVTIPGQSRQRGPAVLRGRGRSAGPRRQVHRLRARVGGHRGRPEDFRDARRRQGCGDRSRRSHARHDPRQTTGAVRHRHRAGPGDLSRRPRHECGPDRDRVLSGQGARARAPVPEARRRRASTTGWPFIASHQASSFRPAR